MSDGKISESKWDERNFDLISLFKHESKEETSPERRL